MLYEELLEEEYIKNIYKGIESNKRIPISHGMPHILNVIGYCKKFAELFKLNEKEEDTLLTAALKLCPITVWVNKSEMTGIK